MEENDTYIYYSDDGNFCCSSIGTSITKFYVVYLCKNCNGNGCSFCNGYGNVCEEVNNGG